MTDEQRLRIVAEETLAWALGREALADIGLTDFALLDERTKIALHNHRYRLGIDELWPGDIPDGMRTD